MRPSEGREKPLRLASLDFLGDPVELRAEVGRLRRSGEIRPAAHHEGADESGSVWVMVEQHGRVESMEVIRHWRERIAVVHFADALTEAYTTATHRALNVAASAALAAGRASRPGQPAAHPSASRRLDPSPDGPSATTGPEQDVDEWLRTTWTTLDDNRAELDRLSRLGSAAGQDILDGEAGERSLVSPNGYLTFRLSGGGLVGISGDARRIASASPEQLRLDALDAFRAAGLASDNRTPGRWA